MVLFMLEQISLWQSVELAGRGKSEYYIKLSFQLDEMAHQVTMSDAKTHHASTANLFPPYPAIIKIRAPVDTNVPGA